MSDPEPFLPTSSDLPAVVAFILPSRARKSSLLALGWGIFVMLLGLVVLLSKSLDGSLDTTTAWPLRYATVFIGGAVALTGLVGMFRCTPGAILASAAAIGSIAAWFGLPLLLRTVLSGGMEPRVWIGAAALLLGPLGASLREVVRYLNVRQMLPLAAGVNPERRALLGRWLRRFVKSDECFDENRVRFKMEDGAGPITSGGTFRPPFMGQLLDDGMLMVSIRKNDYMWLPRENFSDGKFKGNAVAIPTSRGLKTFLFGPASVIAAKRWVYLPVSLKDLRRAVKARKASKAMLTALTDEDDPAVRSLAETELLKAK